MLSRKEIKEKAKSNLGNQIFKEVWMSGVLIYLIDVIIIGGTNAILPGVAGLLILGPIACGVDRVFLKNSRDGQKMEFMDIFTPFKEDFGGTFLLGLLMDIFITLWALLFVIPGVIKAYSWSMAYFIKADHPDYDWRKCMSESARLMNGHKMELFVQELSFIGWVIVGSLCLGIGTFWVGTYINAAKAVFYNELIKQA